MKIVRRAKSMVIRCRNLVRQRSFRLDDDVLWAEYGQACRDVNGSANRGDDIREHVEAVVADRKKLREAS
ncbi:hypothetical protein E1200_26205 [Actinomadura sp. GC306]|uniref:hypothetical protein n=1 Tax=Actinomadura sp. GC306 TaxID=2530367 RepID=UPI00104B2607|nr:hypothetical protein [Actinomadura sp. GC306]TDC62312.1 hypothetical protein E1200_26205 [Actinomadura sp. GC306]